LILLAVGIAFHFLVPVVAPNIPPQFDNSLLFRPWAGWTSTYMVIHPIWYGGLFAAVYLLLRSRKALSPGWRSGLGYGAGMFLAGSFPVFVLAFASFQVSPEVIGVWLAQSFCQYAAAGAVMGAAVGAEW
jgi:hypothetical protein